MKRTASIILSIVLSAVIFFSVGYILRLTQDTSQEPTATFSFNEEINMILDRELENLSEYVSAPVIKLAIDESNRKYAPLTPEAIKAIDDEWQKKDSANAFVSTYLNNTTAKTLLAFQDSHEGFKEIFITDARGLIVGETNRTSDYFQADEIWWQQTYNNGLGLAHHGPVEFDLSAETEGVALYIPIYNDKDQVIGIAKAIFDLNTLLIELQTQ